MWSPRSRVQGVASEPAPGAGVQAGFAPDTFWFLDSPRPTAQWASPDTLDVRGWIATNGRLSGLRLDPGGGTTPAVGTEPRPDVSARYGLPATGFRVTLPAAAHRDQALSVAFRVDETPHSIVIPTRDHFVDEVERRCAKRERLRPHLRCVECGGRLDDAPDALVCPGCGTAFDSTGGRYDFLPPALRDEFGIVATANVSSNSYDGVMVNLINSHPDGLILDCGAGRQGEYYPNVVNLEVVPYDSTDVLAVGERLPFADDTFDCVGSFAVLEHVKDPFRCAAEIDRVLKPGGTLYCQVPFLQPVHAYPNHFYNMTGQGLAGLFPGLEMISTGVLPFGQPIFALSWMLNAYDAGLPAGLRDEFRSMTVAELMAPPDGRLGAPIVRDLSPEARSELACTNYVYARSPLGNQPPAPSKTVN